MKSFIAKILGISAAMVIISWLAFSLFLPEYYLPVLPFTLLFFLIITLLVHAWQLKMAKKDVGKFARSNMIVTFLKLVLYSVYAVVYIANDSENALTFVICLAIIYLIYSVLEVTEISKVTRKN